MPFRIGYSGENEKQQLHSRLNARKIKGGWYITFIQSLGDVVNNLLHESILVKYDIRGQFRTFPSSRRRENVQR